MTRKPPAARTLVAAALLAFSLVVVPTAFAGKGGGHGGGGSGGTTGGTTTFKVVPVNPSSDGQIHWGQQVTYTVVTSATEPHVDLTCTQGGAVVYGATTGFYASYPWPWTQVMTLSSQKWTGGDADCTAQLYYFSGTRKMVLSTITFRAYA